MKARNLMKTKLLMLLALVSLPTFAATKTGDWTLDGRQAYTVDTSGYGVLAKVFITSDSKPAVGFTAYDPSCKGFSGEIFDMPIQLVDDQPIRFQSQCVDRSSRLLMAAYVTGNDFIVDRFKRGKEVSFTKPGSNYVFTYSAIGFTKAYEAVELISKLSEYAL
ncbi:hypothetical protein VPHK45_0044 [Vibrio phage K45]